MTARGKGTPVAGEDANGNPPGIEGDSGNVDKIRDILFGSNMRDYDRRFATVEERLLRESASLRDDMANRLSTAEQFFRTELEALSASLRNEERERMKAMREAMDALSAMNRDLSDRITELTSQTMQQHRDVRGQLQEQHRLHSEDVQRRHQEISEALHREAYALRDAKTDRTALAAMFAELAQQLTGDAGRT
ncbi:MAG: hypothetical protein MNPFHGCM_01407 [Gemmatimonadaceae bacterium]|nr:hypothetical protein [Gemmatimonadaceae bacterium]